MNGGGGSMFNCSKVNGGRVWDLQRIRAELTECQLPGVGETGLRMSRTSLWD